MIKELKVLVVEDEILIAENISDTLKSFGIELIKLSHDKASAIETFNHFCPNIVLLDIRMEGETTGLEIGDFLQSKNTPFMYITSHSDMAMMQKIIKTKPFAYLSKPIKKTDLLANLLLFTENLKNQTSNTLTIKDNNTSFLLNLSEIKYVKSEGNYITIFCDNDKYVFRKNIESFYNELNQNDFYKPHRSYIVNLSKVKSYTKKEILVDDVEIPISRLLVNDFITRIKVNS